MSIPFIDLQAQRARIADKMDAAVLKAVHDGRYIMGPQVAELEGQLAEFCGAKHVIACSNGTDSLKMALLAWGVGPGDAVFVPSFTFASTGEVVALLGAEPVFIDSEEDSFNICPESLARAIDAVNAEQRLTPKAVVPVDLFGLPADYDRILPLAEKHGLKVLCDSAQGFAGTYKGARTGSIGDVTSTSFFPAKPLGCYGDGGALFTNDDHTAEILRSLRVHGKGSDKYDNVRVGLNARLDTVQAAVLIEKLAIYQDEIDRRQKVAQRYTEALKDRLAVPVIPDHSISVWAQYTLKLEHRDAIQAELKEHGVPSMVYYPMPLHLQTAYKHYPTDPEGLPVCTRLSKQVLSLPMHPYLEPDVQDQIIEAVTKVSANHLGAVA